MPPVTLAAASTTATTASTPLQPPLALLRRKPSFVEASTHTNAAKQPQLQRLTLSTVPHLQPVPLAPERLSSDAATFAYLNSIERIAISETHERDGVTFYTLDVYRFHATSRLPTTVAQQQRQSVGVHSVSTANDTAAVPDVRVERRFSDFRKLRAAVYASTLLDPACVCSYCTEFIMYVRLSLQQPRLITKLTTRTAERKAMLASFTWDFVRLGRCKWKQHRGCMHHGPVAGLIAAFVRGDDIDTHGSVVASSRDSVASGASDTLWAASPTASSSSQLTTL